MKSASLVSTIQDVINLSWPRPSPQAMPVYRNFAAQLDNELGLDPEPSCATCTSRYCAVLSNLLNWSNGGSRHLGFPPRPGRRQGADRRVDEQLVWPDAAFEMLRDGSSRQNRKLTAVADDVIRSFTGQSPTPARSFADPR